MNIEESWWLATPFNNLRPGDVELFEFRADEEEDEEDDEDVTLEPLIWLFDWNKQR